jgi:hypothetical protein
MKNKRILKIDRRSKLRAWSDKLAKHLVRFCRDLEDNQRWKYDELSPVQLLEKSKLDDCPVDKDELARSEFFWHRRPRLLPAAGSLAWIVVALGLPVWLFVFPAIGVPVLITSAAVINVGIVQSVRWRREYELSIDGLPDSAVRVSIQHFS